MLSRRQHLQLFTSLAATQDFTKCMQDDGTKQPSQCKLLAEDYIECLHHHKQVGPRERRG